MSGRTHSQENGIDATRATRACLASTSTSSAALAGWRLGEMSINLRATPSFEALGRAFETANPFAFWAQAAQLMWMPWLLAAQTMMLPSSQAKSIAHADHGQEEASAASG
jgi:hypothetical protein